MKVLSPIKEKLLNLPPKNLDYSLICTYYFDMPRNDTEICWYLKRAIQDLIDTN